MESWEKQALSKKVYERLFPFLLIYGIVSLIMFVGFKQHLISIQALKYFIVIASFITPFTWFLSVYHLLKDIKLENIDRIEGTVQEKIENQNKSNSTFNEDTNYNIVIFDNHFQVSATLYNNIEAKDKVSLSYGKNSQVFLGLKKIEE